MATAFISNSNLKGLFPSALSTNASKFTSEKNITGIIRAVVDNNSYIISGPSGANNEYEFVLNGYYFKIIYSNVGQNLWVGIYTDNHDRLIGFTGDGEVTTEMSDGTNFRGLLLGTIETDVIKTVGDGYNSYRLQIVKDGQLNKEAMYKFTQGSIKGVSTYNPESDDPVSSKAIKTAIETLDVAAISGTSGQTITSISETDGKISATFGNISITKSQVSDFSHTHGNITNDGKLDSGSKAVVTNSGTITVEDLTTNSPSAAGTATSFISTISQSSTGKITATKANIGEATSNNYGGIKIGYTKNGKNYPVELSSGQAFVNVPWSDTTYTLSAATSSDLGGIKIGYTTNNTNRNYAVQLDSGKAYVNVP